MAEPRALPGCGENISFEAGGRIVRSLHYEWPRGGNRVRVHDLATGRLLFDQRGGWGKLSADGSIVGVRGADSKWQFIEMATGKTLRTDDKQVILGTGGRMFAVLRQEGLSLVDARTGEKTASWNLREIGALPAGKPRTSTERVRAAVPSPDGRALAVLAVREYPDRARAGQFFSRFIILDAGSAKPRQQFDIDDETLEAITWSPDGKLLAAGGQWSIRVWDTTTGKLKHQFEGHRGPVTALAFSPDGKHLASASKDTTALIWDLE
jgi:WD40 repeat protein